MTPILCRSCGRETDMLGECRKGACSLSPAKPIVKVTLDMPPIELPPVPRLERAPRVRNVEGDRKKAARRAARAARRQNRKRG